MDGYFKTLVILLFTAHVGCASDVADPNEAWQVEERAMPASPAELDSELVWHFNDQRVEPLVPKKRDIWGDGEYRVPMQFNTQMFGREFENEFGLFAIAEPPSFVGFGWPFFEDGRIHMFESAPFHSTNLVHRVGRVELYENSIGSFAGHVLYERGAEPRTEPYIVNEGDDLPDGLASWYENGRRQTIKAFVYRPNRGLWLELTLFPKDCERSSAPCFLGPDYHDPLDPRLVFFGTGSSYQELGQAPL